MTSSDDDSSDNCWVEFFLSKQQERDIPEKSPRKIVARVGVEEVGVKSHVG